MRLQAYMAGMLVTNEQQVVTGSPDLIIVLPADETLIFVPTYDPAAVLAAAPVPLAPVEAVAEAPVESAPEPYFETAQAPATYQGPEPLPPVYASAPPVVPSPCPSVPAR